MIVMTLVTPIAAPRLELVQQTGLIGAERSWVIENQSWTRVAQQSVT